MADAVVQEIFLPVVSLKIDKSAQHHVYFLTRRFFVLCIIGDSLAENRFE
jgi:hypothetical protein